jgi:hypothetical protein
LRHALSNKARIAFRLPHNAWWFQPAISGVADQATIGSWEPTPAFGQEDGDKESRGAADRLVLTFSALMQLEALRGGIRAGTTPASSHILLGHRGTRGVSGHQYTIVVDEESHIWLHDRHSSYGTTVEYDDPNVGERRVKERWLLAFGPDSRDRYGRIIISAGSLEIGIEFPNHENKSPQYCEYLRALVDKTKEDEIPDIQGFGLVSPAATEPPSENQTASDRLLYFRAREIRSGAFRRVFQLIRLRAAKIFAAKVVTPPTTSSKKRRRGEDEPAWLAGIRREYTIVKDSPHVRLLFVFLPFSALFSLLGTFEAF